MGKKIKPRYISKPFGASKELPEPLPEPELIQLTIQLRAGTISKSDRDKIYNGHIRLAIYIAGQYATLHSRKIPDLVGEALLAIGTAIKKAPEKLQDDSFTPFCAVQIHSAVSVFLRNDHVVNVPQETFRKSKIDAKIICGICGKHKDDAIHKELNREDANENHEFAESSSLQKLKVLSLNISKKLEQGDYMAEETTPWKRTLRAVHHYRRVEVRPELYYRELQELIQESIHSEEEEQVIQLRKMEYTDAEIAQKLDMSETKIRMLRTRVEKRFEKYERGLS